jgi:G3E family GTPase
MIPISVVTGFLGSGKTTLIGRVLRDPAFARTAVIVNEFGEIGLDHDLITVSDDQILTLSTGCLCCAVQSDLASTLMQLHQRREVGSAVFDRVLIETSGLADPVPVLQSLMTDPGVAATYQVPVVITLVDAVHGETTLQHHPEARHQVVLADKLLISKTDLQPIPEPLSTALAALNSSAARMTTLQAGAAVMFDTVAIGALVERLTQGRLAQERRTPWRRPSHDSDIETFVLTRDLPMPALALTLLLQAVAEHCGSRLLRLKGLVAIEEMPGQPAVIHGVRHVVSSPDFLARWPSQDTSTRIVFITRFVPRHFISRLLDAIETEVRDAMAH